MTANKKLYLSPNCSSSWVGGRLLSLFEAGGLEEVFEPAMEYVRKKRVLDVALVAGKVSAKVQDAQARPLRVMIGFPQFTDAQWELVLSKLAERSLYLASLLAGSLPEEIEQAFLPLRMHLFPSSGSDLRFYCDCRASRICAHLGALGLRLVELAENDPFAIFTLRGRGRDELLLELGRYRAAALLGAERNRSEPIPDEMFTQTEHIELQSFWRANPKIFELHYSIRADELPAAILRQLDPLPLGLPEEPVERIFEEIYSCVARRAQAYGLGFRSVG